jgi:hypothetical protein
MRIDEETGEKILIEAPQGYERALYEHKNVTACNERAITHSAFHLLTFNNMSIYKCHV